MRAAETDPDVGGGVIVAPATSPAEARALIAAGAGELYVGVLTDRWAEEFGTSDLLTRRQGRVANVRRLEDLGEMVRIAAEARCPLSLALNARYSAEQLARVMELVASFEAMGGGAVITADLGLLLRLRGARLRRHVSLLAGVTNAEGARFFAELGASRIILPRELDLDAIGTLVRDGPPLEYEVVTIFQRCPFIDGRCGFHHDVRIPEGVPAVFDYEWGPTDSRPQARAADPSYEGHGCELAWRTGPGRTPVGIPRADDAVAPPCAACRLGALRRAGVRFFKVAGRGYPTSLLARGVAFLRDADTLASVGEDSGSRIRARYAAAFGQPCYPSSCYAR